MPSLCLQSIDALRVLALALMVAYHFCHARTFILSLFLLVAGISLTLATHDGVRLRPYLKRLGLVAGCAALISVTSHLMFGLRWSFFGVLHSSPPRALGLAFVRPP